MARVAWKDSAVVSIQTRKGHHVLAQMSRDPFLVFFDVFRSDPGQFAGIDLEDAPILFCSAVTRQFLKSSSVERLTELAPRAVRELPTRWIHRHPESYSATVWSGTEHERTFISLGPGGALVEKEVLHHQGRYDHPSGVFDRVLIANIDPNDDETIDAHEMTSLAVFPATNERLFLCEQLERSLDPEKDVLFDREIPLEYSRYVDIVSASSDTEQAALLSLYR